jgi:hypothetical protein
MKSEQAKSSRGRGSISVATAAAVLAAVVVGVGAGSYVTLSVFGGEHSSSSTTHSCHPAGSPACTGPGNSTGRSVPRDPVPVAVLGDRAS